MTADEVTGAGDRVLPLLSDSGNRRLLTEWVEEHPSYEFVDLQGTIEETPFDVCILDSEAFEEHLPGLRAKKAAATPVVLPYLLLLEESDPEIIDLDGGELADNVVTESIDEIVTMPIQQAELQWRLAALLRLREQSLTLRQRGRDLEQQVDLFERAQDIADVGGWEYSPQTDELTWTEKVYQIHDLPKDAELTAETAIEYYHPEDRDTIREAFWGAVEDAESYDFDIRLVTDEGDQRWVRTRGEPYYEDGEVASVRGTIQDITDRKENERAMQQARDQYRTIFEASNDAILIIDPDADEVVATNSQASALFGYDRGALLDDVSPQAIYGGDEDQFREFVDEVFDSGEGWTDELTCTRRDGRHVPAEISASTIEFEGRSCLLASIRDISTRKESERELRRVSQAVEASAHAIFITDPDGTITYTNPAFEEITGFSREEAVGKTPDILNSGAMHDGYFGEFWTTIRSGEVWDDEVINRRKDGETFTAHQTVAPVTDGDDEIEAFVAVQTDITERKQHERRLQRQSRAIDEAPIGISISDPTGADNPMIYVNDAFVEITGYPREDVLGRNCRFLQGENTDSERVARIRDAIDAQEPVAVEIRNYRKDGTEFWNHLEIAPVRNAQDEVINYVGFQQDVTERRERHQQLETIDRLLRHNLRNDMNVIRGRAELIHSESSGDVAELAEKIIDVSDGLLGMARKERAIAKVLLEDPVQAETPIEPVLQRVVSTIESDHPEATIAVESPEAVTVRATAQFEEALAELVENGVVHNDSAAPEVTITVTRSDGSTHIDVADTGPRIPEMEQNILEEATERTPVYHETGLGLWFAKLVVTRSGGTITVTENTPAGSTVRVTFHE